ncbi:MAG: hypothetical protein Q7T83_06735 [Thermodesulfovibrionales bacterium]|nr:hypothetical protein [Thermodesulfovibrionales bacterium]MDP3111478.1 hypothetical protein [Thermodesulfovibrionales bacterium]
MYKKYLFEEVVKTFNKKHIRYLLIGRQALLFYGAPLFTYDYDFWIHPEDKAMVFDYLEDTLGMEASRDRTEKRPIFAFHSDSADKIDVFIARKITNKEGETLDIDECLSRAVEIRQPDSDFHVRLPSIDDLIKLKKMGKRPKDLEDIEYLETIKKLRGKKRGKGKR